jgi:YVTN family beta-propeller protein
VAERTQRLTTVVVGFLVAGFSLAGILRAAEAPATQPSGYHVARTFPIGGDGGWDYITYDADGDRLFVSRSDRVMVINAKDGTSLGTIAQVTGSHGIALAPEAGRGFATCGRSNDCVVFDLKTLATIGRVPTGQRPDGIFYDPATKFVWVLNGGSNNATVIDPAKPLDKSVVGTVDLGGKPEAGVSDGHGRVYVNLEDMAEIAVIDAKGLVAKDHWSLGAGSGPTGLACDPVGKCLYSGCEETQTLVVINTETGKVIASVPTGKGVDACGFDSKARKAFASARDGTLTVLSAIDPKDVGTPTPGTASTHTGARTLAVDENGQRVFLPAADFEPQAQGERRPRMKAGTFVIVVVEKDSP